jgi:hypothetical protein
MISFNVRREFWIGGRLAGTAVSPLLRSEVLPRIGETVVGGTLAGATRHSHHLRVTNVEHVLAAAAERAHDGNHPDAQVVVRTDSGLVGEVERALDELQEAGWASENFIVDRDLW